MSDMVTEKIKKLQVLQAQTAELAAAIEKERTAELAELPTRYGFADLNEFIKAVKAAAEAPKARRGRKPGKGAAPAAPKAEKAPKPAKEGKRKRVKITDELKQQIKAAVEAGRTGAEISKAFGISVPSVQNIKKEFGMVKERASKVAAPAAPVEPAVEAVPTPEFNN